MITIGEKLNSSIPKTLQALENHDEKYVVRLIKKQGSAGAGYLDINTALTNENEIENMRWLIQLTLNNTDCGIMLDSPNPAVFEQVLPMVKGRKTIINSITMEAQFDPVIALAAKYQTGIVCLPMESHAIPDNASQRLENASTIIEKLRGYDIPDKNIYVDVLVEAVATNQNAAATALETIRLIKETYPVINTICGLSNVSFGLPGRARLNALFLTMAMQNGLDSAIVDVVNKEIQEAVYVSDVLLGKDEYCMGYIQYYRDNIKS